MGVFKITAIMLMAVSIFISEQSYAGAASGSASVEIRQPVAVSQAVPLAFGLVSADSADVITLTPAGIVTSQNGATISSGSVSPGQFIAAGAANAAVIISFADGVLTGTGIDLAINNLVHGQGATPSFDASGALDFAVGGDLVINDGQTPGLYSGTYQVSVNYQ